MPGSRASTAALGDPDFCTAFDYQALTLFFLLCNSVAQQLTLQGELSDHRELLEAELVAAGFCPFSGTTPSDLAGSVTFPSCSVFQRCDGHQGFSQCCWVTGTTYSSVQEFQNLAAAHSPETANCVLIPIQNLDFAYG